MKTFSFHSKKTPFSSFLCIKVYRHKILFFFPFQFSMTPWQPRPFEIILSLKYWTQHVFKPRKQIAKDNARARLRSGVHGTGRFWNRWIPTNGKIWLRNPDNVQTLGSRYATLRNLSFYISVQRFVGECKQVYESEICFHINMALRWIRSVLLWTYTLVIYGAKNILQF